MEIDHDRLPLGLRYPFLAQGTCGDRRRYVKSQLEGTLNSLCLLGVLFRMARKVSIDITEEGSPRHAVIFNNKLVNPGHAEVPGTQFVVLRSRGQLDDVIKAQTAPDCGTV
jgi:hypothetical protein